MAWTDEELRRANLDFGTSADRYRFSLPGVNGKPGKRLDVPGYFVGDPKLVRTLQRAASIVSERLPEELRKRGQS